MAKATATKPAKKPAAKKKPAATPKPAKAQPQLRVRMYRQGLGDCFLLTFPKVGGGEFHMLIDCGVIIGNPDAARLINLVVDDIAKTTNNHL